jgi:hypothetical protein
MSFNDRETSRAAGLPINLYDIRYGPEDTSIRYYTNLATELVIGSGESAITYLPLPIKHSDIVSTGGLDKTSVELELPESCDIAALYSSAPPSTVVSVIIRQGHAEDLDFKVCWAGKVLGGSFREAVLVLDCEPISSSLRRTGLTRTYQYACPLVLYGTRCGASKAAATSAATVGSVSGPLVTLSGDWAPSGLRDKFIGGMAEWEDASGRVTRRGIVNRAGNVLTLSSEIPAMEASDTLSIVLGCSHLQEDCAEVHDNILNFGGQPAIPLKNPTGITNSYN